MARTAGVGVATVYRQTIGWSRRPGPGAARIDDLVSHTQGEVRALAEQLVKRAQDAGVLRTDVDAGDMFLLTMAVQSVLEVGGPDRPAPPLGGASQRSSSTGYGSIAHLQGNIEPDSSRARSRPRPWIGNPLQAPRDHRPGMVTQWSQTRRDLP